jgi:GDP-L-fucose synthase
VDLGARIYVAGHRGLVGSAIVRRLRSAGYSNLLLRGREQLDLTDQRAVGDFFGQGQPEFVFLAAAKVGGILANSTYPADFIRQNLMIQTNVIDAAYRSGVARLLFLGSSCIYPKLAPQPLKEEYLLTGPLEPTNRPYALAKIAGIEMCWSYNRQYGTSFLSAMPTNLYGPGDQYDLNNSHVIPGLIRKMHEAKAAGAGEVDIWGTGNPRREFLYSDAAADACIFLLNLPEEKFRPLTESADVAPMVNVGCGEDVTIADLARLVAEIVGFRGRLQFDAAKSDGTPRKLMDVGRLRQLGWNPPPPEALREGLQKAYEDFLQSSGERSGSRSVPA